MSRYGAVDCLCIAVAFAHVVIFLVLVAYCVVRWLS